MQRDTKKKELTAVFGSTTTRVFPSNNQEFSFMISQEKSGGGKKNVLVENKPVLPLLFLKKRQALCSLLFPRGKDGRYTTKTKERDF